MKKFLKFLISALTVILLLVIIAAAVLPFVVDPNDFKPQISNQVKKATGRDLILGGDIDLSVFPWLGVGLKEVSLSNAPDFGETPFAKATDMEVRVKLLPLLQRRVVMDTIVLRDLDLNLARNTQGKTNWEDLIATRTEEDVPAPPPEKKDPTQKATTPLAGIAIAGLKVEAARVHWRDEIENVNYTIEQLNLTTDPLVPGKPTNVDLAFDFTSDQPRVKGQLAFHGNLTANLETNHYRLQDTDLRLTTAGEALPIEQLSLQLRTNAEVFLAQQQLTVSDLKLTSQVQGPQAAELALTTSLEGDLATQQYNFKALQLITHLKDPQFPKPLNATLNTTANIDLLHETLSLKDLNLATVGVKWNGYLNGTQILTSPHLNGQLLSDEFNPRKLAAALALELPPTADDAVLNHARLAMKFSASPESFETPALLVKLDESTLKGGVAIHNFQQPATRFDLTLDAINLDRYLPPPSTKEANSNSASPPIPGGAAAGAGEIPLEFLRTLDARGTLKIGKLTVAGIHSEGIRITLGAKDGLVELHPLSARLYQGTYTGDVRLDARTDPPQLTIDEKLTGVKAGPFLKDFLGDDKILGTADVHANLTARGTTPEAIRRTLNGTAGFSFTEGAVKGINLAQLIREAQARLEDRPLPTTGEPQQTDFTSLAGTLTATDGILRNNDFEAKSPFLRVQGQGSVNLVQESLDYQLKIAIVKTLAGQGGKGLTDLKGITIPFQISGTLSQPKYSLALKDLLKAKAKAEAEKLIEEKSPLIQEQLEQRLDRLLGIQPGKETAPAEGEVPSPSTLTPEEQLKEELKQRLRGIF